RPNWNFEMTHDSRELLARADAAIVCSGTSTLEAALLNAPQVVVYRTTALNYQVIRRLIKVKQISLANIVAGSEVAPEMIQNDVRPEPLADKILNLLQDDATRRRMLEGYAEIRNLLGSGGAAVNTANLAMRLLTI
ncbi:MAG: lipid-A-disaccharide synthase, partial [Calditrichota bacterium]